MTKINDEKNYEKVILNIYSIKGFDSEQKQYVYNVNANTGVSNLNGNPYQVQIGLRYGF